jgi:mRNA interferase RelE/StbE
MKTDFRKSFLNDIKKVKDKTLLEKVEQVILNVEKAKTIQDIFHLKKLKGNKKGIYYRITLGIYRIGVTIENDTVTFVVFDARKNIYTYFP